MTRFYKLSGGGNDFIGLLEPASLPDSRTLALWCRRGLSIGADGVFVLNREIEGIRFDYWNSDGEKADFCANAARCAVRLAHEVGWIGSAAGLRTAVGNLQGTIVDEDKVEVDAPLPGAPTQRSVTTSKGSFEGWSTAVGVPHFIIFVDDGLADLAVAELAPEIRSHSDFGPSGTNVDWVQKTSPGSPAAIRSFERGVEGETLACGSGVLSAAAACVAAGSTLPLAFSTRGGSVFEVQGRLGDAGVTAWSLLGDARLIASGVIERGAAAC